MTRLVLTPLEESAAIYFSSNIRHHTNTPASSVSEGGGLGTIPKKAITTFISLLRLIIVLGLIVCIFGFPYSKTVVQIYGGDVLTENEGKMFSYIEIWISLKFYLPTNKFLVYIKNSNFALNYDKNQLLNF